MRTRWIAALYFVLTTPAMAVGNGMYLCRSPVVANDFWNDVVAAKGLNLPITSDVLKRIGEKNQCRLVLSADLKPTDFVANQMLMSNGSIKGWANPRYYILYVNGSNS